MGINFRGPAAIPDGSITNAKLANNAVDSTKLADNAVIDTKIASNAVTNAKIANDAVTPSKVTQSIATTHFTGTEGEYSSLGTTPFSVWEFNFTKDTTGEMDNWVKAGFSVNLKSTSGSATSTAELFIDNVSYGSVSNMSTVYATAGITDRNISALAAGLHKAELRIYSDSPSESAFVNAWDVFLSKK